LKLKILKKLRTASLNSAFTGSYKKSVNQMPTVQKPETRWKLDKSWRSKRI